MATRSGGGSRSGSSRSSGSRSGGSRAGGARAGSARAGARTDKSVQQFREALERSVTLSRDRIQEVMDDAVERGRMTRGDANEVVSRLVSRGRQYTDDLVKELERLLDQARREFETRARPARRRATQEAGRAARAVRDAADAPLAQADRLRRRARVPGFPITGYDRLTASQVRARLADLSPADLRKVRTQEKRGKARKSVLRDIEARLK
jgi:polyhydroxyalkanoate synthesis regulator phasin